MARNGNLKGKVGEREIAAVLREYGLEARRSQQYHGAAGDADVVCSIPWLHIEVKRVEKLNIRLALEQAGKDSKGALGCPRTPVVFHRSNRSPWMATLALDDLLTILVALLPPQGLHNTDKP